MLDQSQQALDHFHAQEDRKVAIKQAQQAVSPA
jgi:hypothetical protein